MTDPTREPSEQEETAATMAIFHLDRQTGEGPKYLSPNRARDFAHPALTAAAQLREGAANGWQMVPKEATTAMVEAGMWVHEHEGRDCWRKMRSAAPEFAPSDPALMPIYGATEPDSGPSVLGNEE